MAGDAKNQNGTCADCTIQRQAELIRRMAGLLKRCESVGGDVTVRCPVCHADRQGFGGHFIYEEASHAPDCELASVLREFEANANG